MHREFPRQGSIAFDTDTKMMATVNGTGEAACVHVKGAPEAVLDAAARVMTGDGTEPMTDGMRRHLIDLVEDAGASGLRLLGIAQRDVPQDHGDVLWRP